MDTHTHTHTHTHTQDNYSNPRCTHARRGLMIFIFQSNDSNVLKHLGYYISYALNIRHNVLQSVVYIILRILTIGPSWPLLSLKIIIILNIIIINFLH